MSRKKVSHLLSVSVITILRETTWERGASFGTKCIVVGKSQHWALETTGHIASTAKKQRAMDADTFATFPCTADPKPEDGSTHSGRV